MLTGNYRRPNANLPAPRASRRAALATLILVTQFSNLVTVAGAQSADAAEPTSDTTEQTPKRAISTFSIFSPLHLVSGEMHSNPFVSTPQSFSSSPIDSHVVRASDEKSSEIRLKTIGKAVGLVRIGEQAASKTAVVIEPASAPRVQVNPLVDTTASQSQSSDQHDLPPLPEPICFSLSDDVPVPMEPANSSLAEVIRNDAESQELETEVEPPAESGRSREAEFGVVSSRENEFAILKKRHRAAVAVQLPSGMLPSRSESLSDVPAVSLKMVEPVEKLPSAESLHEELSSQHPYAESGTLTSLRIGQATAADIPGMILQVEVVDPNRCQAMGVQSRRLMLIGRETGSTRVLVRYENDSDQSIEEIAYDVQIVTPTPTANTASDDRVMTDLIRERFPKSQVELIREGNALRVKGQCDSREEATQIVRTIRKAHLVPVKDEIVIR